jgi:hypothetical protein
MWNIMNAIRKRPYLDSEEAWCHILLWVIPRGQPCGILPSRRWTIALIESKKYITIGSFDVIQQGHPYREHLEKKAKSL